VFPKKKKEEDEFSDPSATCSCEMPRVAQEKEGPHATSLRQQGLFPKQRNKEREEEREKIDGGVDVETIDWFYK
jgi:hypothetical protein